MRPADERINSADLKQSSSGLFGSSLGHNLSR